MTPSTARQAPPRDGSRADTGASASTGAGSRPAPGCWRGCRAGRDAARCSRSTARCSACCVEGAFQRVSPPQVESAVARVARGGLTSVDLEAVRAEVEAIPWVDMPSCSARWPDAHPRRRSPSRWRRRAGTTPACSTRAAQLFIRNARFVPPELPLLEGPEGSEGAVAQLYPRRAGPAARGGFAAHGRPSRRARRLGARDLGRHCR